MYFYYIINDCNNIYVTLCKNQPLSLFINTRLSFRCQQEHVSQAEAGDAADREQHCQRGNSQLIFPFYKDYFLEWCVQYYNVISLAFQELDLLESANIVYKLIGPVLVKQDLDEAKATVTKRLEYINGEM